MLHDGAARLIGRGIARKLVEVLAKQTWAV